MENDRVLKLLLAFRVREIAIDLRRRHAATEHKKSAIGASENFDSFAARFALAHPLSEYTAEAIKELSDIADSL